MVDIEWKESRITNRGNQYFHYPKGDMEFKDEVVKSGGWVAHIYKNGIFIDKIEADSSVVWQSPIFTHIKTTTINSKDIEQIYENCKIYAVPKGYEDMLPPKVTKTDFDKDKFLNLIKAFMDKVDELRKINSIKGTGRGEWYVIEVMENLLQNIGYEPHFSFGSGKLLSGKGDKVCGIAFCRSNTIGNEFVSENLVSTGVYIWLGYADQEVQPYLKLAIGCGEKTKECIAIDTIEKHHNNGKWEFTYNSNDFETQKEQIAKDFLYLVKEFDSIPLEHFKPKGDVMDNITKIPPLNQILYGPPGTGKTYSTIDKTLEILGYAKSNDNGKVILDYTKIKQKLQNIANDKKGAELDLKNLDSKNDRELAKLLFDYYRSAEHNKEQRQIEFVTFHQSFSYEEFVEGIKPKLIDSSNGAESSEMSYTIKSGIFKEICNRALKDLQEIQERIKSNPYVWKVSLEQTDSELYKYCLKNNEIRIGFQHEGGDKNASVRHFRDEMQKGDIVGIRHDEQSFNAIGVIVGDCDEKNIDKRATITETYPITRKIKWILIDNVKNIQDKKLDRNTVYQLDTTAKDLFAEIQDRVDYAFDDLPKQITRKDLPKKPYILIIDEINRGNISKILGELITLIEPSKRIGASDEEKARGIGNESLEVTLPYSNEIFGVPSNLYIIGTMNTADRSIALLDTALRRRFEFIEMMPDCKELQKIWLVENDEDYENSSIDEWNTDKAKVLYEILTAINNRIEFLLDREHTIGHAFFFEKAKLCKSNRYQLSLDSLKEIFAKKIIPLLQEYFYDDYAKIDAVLGGNGMVEKAYKSVVSLFQNPKSRPDDLEDKTIYNIAPLNSEIWDNPQTYKSIYGVDKVEDSRDFSESDKDE